MWQIGFLELIYYGKLVNEPSLSSCMILVQYLYMLLLLYILESIFSSLKSAGKRKMSLKVSKNVWEVRMPKHSYLLLQ